MDRPGLVEGGTPKKSGRFVVRLPQSLHAVLEREAIAEGVSLNQLVVAKLSVGLGRLTGLAIEKRSGVVQETTDQAIPAY
jgi:hypothetical protein